MAQLPSKSDPGSATKSSPPGDHALAEESVKAFVSALPAREGWSEPLVQYKSYWFRPGFLERFLLVERRFRPRPNDIVLATQPKCGTTWLKALAFAITNRSRYDFVSNHPLLTRHPQQIVPFIEIPDDQQADIEALSSPRFLATHMPLSLLPADTTSCGCRVVYLCRVSRLHFENKLVEGLNLSMDGAFSMFCEGFSHYGPFWNHCLDYWNESVAKPSNVLFLKYEELKADPVQVVGNLAKFLGAPFTEEEESSGIAQEVVKLCSFETLTSLDVNQVGAVLQGNRVHFSNSMFYRKGEVGDWVNHMSHEMGEELDTIVRQKLQGSGLVF